MSNRTASVARGLGLALGSGLALGLLCACGPESLSFTPPELLGSWRTDAPGYEDRILEFQNSALVWRLGSNGKNHHQIKDIDVVPKDRSGVPSYRFHYLEDDDYEATLTVHIVSDEPRVIHLGARGQKWKWVEEK